MPVDVAITSCKFCKHYDPIGRRGGSCQRLEVPVSGEWPSCSLAEAPFDFPGEGVSRFQRSAIAGYGNVHLTWVGAREVYAEPAEQSFSASR